MFDCNKKDQGTYIIFLLLIYLYFILVFIYLEVRFEFALFYMSAKLVISQ